MYGAKRARDDQQIAHYGGPGMQMANGVKSSGQIDVVGDSILYNATVVNTLSDAQTYEGRPAQYRDQRDKPILNHPEEYEMSILRLAVDTTTMPIFQPRAQIGQCDPNLLDYKVGYRLDYQAAGLPNYGLMDVPALTPIPVTSSGHNVYFTDFDGTLYTNAMPLPPPGQYAIANFMAMWNYILAQNSLEVRIMQTVTDPTPATSAYMAPQFVIRNTGSVPYCFDFSADTATYAKASGNFLVKPAKNTIGAVATANYLGAPARTFTVDAYSSINFPNFFKVGPMTSVSLACFKSLYWTPEDKTASNPAPPLSQQDYGVSSTSTYYNAYTMEHVLDNVVNPAIESVLYTDTDFNAATAFFGGQSSPPTVGVSQGTWNTLSTYTGFSIVSYNYLSVSQSPFAVIAACTVAGSSLFIPAQFINASNPLPSVGMIVQGPVSAAGYTSVTAVNPTPISGFYVLTLSQAAPSTTTGGTATFFLPTTGYFYTIPQTVSSLNPAVGVPPIVNASQANIGSLSPGWYDANVPMSGYCIQRQLTACNQAIQSTTYTSVWTGLAASYVPLFPVQYKNKCYVAKNVIINSTVPPSLDTTNWFAVGVNPWSTWDPDFQYALQYAKPSNSSYPYTYVTYQGIVYSLTSASTPVKGTAPPSDASWVVCHTPPSPTSGGPYKAGGYYIAPDSQRIVLCLKDGTTDPGLTTSVPGVFYNGVTNFQLVEYTPSIYVLQKGVTQFVLTSSPSYFSYDGNTNLFSVAVDTYSAGGQFRDSDKVSAAVNSTGTFNGLVNKNTGPYAINKISGYSAVYSTWPSLPVDLTVAATVPPTTVGNIVEIPWNGGNPFVSSNENLVFLSDMNFKSLIDNFSYVTLPANSYIDIYNSPASPESLTTPPLIIQWNFNYPSEKIYTLDSSVASYPNRLTTSTVTPQNYSEVGLRIFSTEASYYIYTQDYPSTASAWCPVAAIAVTTEAIPIVTELEGNPLQLAANGSSFAIADSSAKRKPIITDFAVALTSCFGYRGLIYYAPSGEYRFSSLSNRQMTQIDFSVFWRHRITGDLIPVLINGGGGYASIKFLFRPKKQLM